MKTIRLNGRDVSSLILGTDYFGTTVSREDSFAILDKFAAFGGNAVDTARLYASWLPGGIGASEKTIGEWIAQRRNREELYLITKGGAPEKGSPLGARLSREELTYDLEESLHALGTDHIDLYFLHRDDEKIPVEDIMPILHDFVKSGKVLSIGASNWRTGRISAANAFAEKEGLTPFTASEIQWSLARSTPELQGDESLVCMNEDEFTAYRKMEMPVFGFSSQAKGFFQRGIAEGMGANNAKAISRFQTPENLARLERVRALAEKKHISVASVVLGYITSQTIPAAALLGPKKLSQLEDSLTAADTTLSCEECTYLTNGALL